MKQAAESRGSPLAARGSRVCPVSMESHDELVVGVVHGQAADTSSTVASSLAA